MYKLYQQAPSHEAGHHDARQKKKEFSIKLINMIASLLVGLGFAIGHHFFYRSLDTRIVADSISQAWSIRIGTGAAFLVRLSFAVASSIAYVQRQWTALKKRSFKLSELDAMTGVLDNALCFVHVSLWARFPLLAAMASITWLFSFAVVLTPGTLSVQNDRRVNTISTAVPQYGFSNSSGYYESVPTQLGGLLPTQNVVRIAFTTAVGGEILNIPSAYQNSSYSLQFYGPGLVCGNANSSIGDMIVARTKSANFSAQYLTFAAWVPGDPYMFSNNTTALPIPTEPIDLTSTDVARLYISSSPWPPLPYTNTTSLNIRPNITECQLFNTSYNVNYTHAYPSQDLSINSLTHLNPIPFPPNITSSKTSSHSSYEAIMYSFGQLLIGTVQQDRTSVRQRQYNTKLGYLPHPFTTWLSHDSAAAVSALFQNITLSMLNDPVLALSITDATKDSLSVPVAVTTDPAVYIYKPMDLILAYGISFVCAAACTAIGIFALIENERVYSNQFSTYVGETGIVIKGRDRGSPEGISGGERNTQYHGHYRSNSTAHSDDDGLELLDRPPVQVRGVVENKDWGGRDMDHGYLGAR